jgi:thymidine phosphorylase
MVELGRRAGREVVCELTDMDQPLGRAVGNALEIREAIETLRGNGPPDLVELVLSAAGHLLALSDLGIGYDEGRRRAAEVLATGAALEAYERWIAAQGGDPDLDSLPRAKIAGPVPADQTGFVQRIATTAVGEAALRLGAGRAKKDDRIDHSVGIVMLAKRGDRVEVGQPLAEVHAQDAPAAERAAREVQACYRIGAEEPERRPIVLDVLT